MGGGGDEGGRVLGEGGDEGRAEEGAEEPTEGGDDGGSADGEPEDAEETVVLAGTEVIAGNGHHTLVETDDGHDDEEVDAVDDAVTAHGGVAAIVGEGAHEEDGDAAVAGIDEEIGKADGEALVADAQVGVDYAFKVGMDEFGLVAEEVYLPDEHTELGQDGGDGGTAYAEVENEDEEGAEETVEEDRADGGVHRYARSVRGTEQAVESEIEMRDDIAGEDDLHKLSCGFQGDVTGSEEAENGVEKEE